MRLRGGADWSPTAFGDAGYVRTRWRADPTAAFGAEVGGELVGSNFATRWGSVGFFEPLTIRPDLWASGSKYSSPAANSLTPSTKGWTWVPTSRVTTDQVSTSSMTGGSAGEKISSSMALSLSVSRVRPPVSVALPMDAIDSAGQGPAPRSRSRARFIVVPMRGSGTGSLPSRGSATIA